MTFTWTCSTRTNCCPPSGCILPDVARPLDATAHSGLIRRLVEFYKKKAKKKTTEECFIYRHGRRLL